MSKSLRIFYYCYLQVCFDDDRSENLNSSITRFVILSTLLVMLFLVKLIIWLRYDCCVDSSYHFSFIKSLMFLPAWVILWQCFFFIRACLFISDHCLSVSALYLLLCIFSLTLSLHTILSKWLFTCHIRSWWSQRNPLSPMNNTVL
jgi:hypothetical protein